MSVDNEYEPKRGLEESGAEQQPNILGSKVYDTLKWITSIVLPAIATLYLALSQTWGLPHGEKIAATIMLVVTAMGSILQVSASQYKKTGDGTITIDTSDPEKDRYHLALDIPIDEVTKRDQIVFKVDSQN